MSSQAVLRTGEEVNEAPEGLVVSFDKKYDKPEKKELISDCYGNLKCPDTGQILFCHRVPSNLRMLYDTF
jgi:hypothetical protein